MSSRKTERIHNAALFLRGRQEKRRDPAKLISNLEGWEAYISMRDQCHFQSRGRGR
jgi:hypothetical protein